MVRLYLFGTPRVERDGQLVTPGRSKALALLAYLAVTGQAHEREHLATLLWPELDLEGARNGLRRELSLLRAGLGAEVLVADRRRIAGNPTLVIWTDVAHFRAQVARVAVHGHGPDELCASCAEALAEAVALYGDDFMAGLTLADCPVFDEWQFFEREALRDQLARALQWLGAWHQRRTEYEAAITLARRWLQLDPLHEPAHRMLMELYAAEGRHSAALRQYQECARLLEAELGTTPEAETTTLAEVIRTRRVTAQPAGPAAAEQPPPAPARAPEAHRRLPPQTTPLLGREQEIENLRRYLESPHARLVTLVGPGGIGKTRLASELALREEARYPDGVAFAALQPVAGPELLVAAIADAVGCRLSGHAAPHIQLVSHLADRTMLLVLDNFEHLLGGAELLSELLAAAPGLRLLVTSREVLNLQEEWSYPLGGLAIPPEEGAGSEQYAAARLFAERARRVRPDFALTAERVEVARICRLVEGLPLAIELAAAWASAMSCGQIATEIARGLAFLVGRQRNLPERHRSMRAVFDASWEQLGPEEQAAFLGLAIFRGGFSADAATSVTGASRATLATLTDKSLVRLEAGGRYQIHELLRQYAEERLEGRPADAARARQAHSDYYLAFLAERDEAVSSGRDFARTAEIGAELENVRVAWRHAAAAGTFEQAGRAVDIITNFYLYRGPYEEGIEACEQAIQSLRRATPGTRRDRILAEALHDQAWLYLNVGQFAMARARIAETQQIYARLGNPPTGHGRAGDPLAGLTMLALMEGNYAGAARLAETYLHTCQADTHVTQRPFAWYLLARTALAQGLYARARHAAEQAYAAVRAASDRWFEAYVLIDLGRAAMGQGQLDEARRHFQASYAIREAFDDPEGKALALYHEGMVALREGEPAEASELFGRSLAIYRTRGDRRGLAEANLGQGMANVALDRTNEAAAHFRAALALAWEVQSPPLTLAVLVSVSELLIARGRPDEARDLLVLALRHPATERETSDQAHQLLLAHEQELAPDPGRVTPEVSLEGVVARLLAELTALEQSHAARAQASAAGG